MTPPARSPTSSNASIHASIVMESRAMNCIERFMAEFENLEDAQDESDSDTESCSSSLPDDCFEDLSDEGEIANDRSVPIPEAINGHPSVCCTVGVKDDFNCL
jgi:hypothetical protein